MESLVGDQMSFNCELTWSTEEKLFCLSEIDKRLKRILFVYERSLIDESYNYKAYVYAVILYVASVKNLFGCELTNVIVNLNSLYMNDFEKTQIRKLVLESKHIIREIQKMG